MMSWAETLLDGMWRGAVAIVPLALLVALITSRLKRTPGTRHALWLAVLLALVVLPFLPASPAAQLGATGSTDSANEIDSSTAVPDAKLESATEADWTDDDLSEPLRGEWAPEAFEEPHLAALGIKDSVRKSRSQPQSLDRDYWLGGFALHPIPFRRDVALPADQLADANSDLASPNSLESFFDRDALVKQGTKDYAVVWRALSTLLQVAGVREGDAANLADTRDADSEFKRACAKYLADEDENLPALPARIESNNPYPPSYQLVSEGHAVAAIEPAPKPSYMWNRAVSLLTTWRTWIGQLAAARDALGAVSPIPFSLWLTGAIVYALLQCVLALRLSRQLAVAEAAPRDVERLVTNVAQALRLRRVPVCVIVRQRLSPMIWCGWRKRLVLPADLWADLDEDGRRAVVTHELAHLRRRDHWVRWIDVLIGCVYWWHPVMWWVRSRINAEAEVCCDTWVTWLNPRKRKAYAAALLTARQYVSSEAHAAPAVGIGAGTRKTKSFARRLTMIMTRKDAPGLSPTSFVLAAAIVLTGWMATPAESCDKTPKCTKAKEYVVADDATFAIAAAPASDPQPAPNVYFVSSPGEDRDDEGDLEDRLDRLERQMSKLMGIMERSEGRAKGLSFSAPSAPHAPHEPHAPFGLKVPKAPKAPKALSAPRAPGIVVTPDGTSLFGGSEQYSQEYKLSKGKLGALTKLMVRDDVPVLVSPGDDSITVHGTAAQHAVFARFVGIIGNEKRQNYKMPEGKLDAFSKLMIRNDVPIRVSPGEGHIGVDGTPEQQEIVGDFIRMINGENVSTSQSQKNRKARLRNRSVRALPNELKSQRQELARARKIAAEQLSGKVRESLRTQRGEIRNRLRDVQRHRDDFERQRENLLREADRLREEADRMRDDAERMREEADRARERVNSHSEDPNLVKEHSAQFADAQTAVAKFEHQVAMMQAEAELQAAQAQNIEIQMEALEEQAAMLEEHAQEIEDNAQDQIEEIEEELEDALEEELAVEPELETVGA